MRKPSRLDYAYAVGRVRALEKRLVSKPAFLEAATEKDLPSALKVIFDAGYFLQESVEVQDSSHLEEFLEIEEQSLSKLLSELLIEGEIARIIIQEKGLEQSLLLCQELAYPFITDYIRHRIDLGNLKMFCRAKYLGLPLTKLKTLLLKGGFLDRDVLFKSFDLSFAEVEERLYASSYQQVWARATDALTEKETFIDLEREFEDFLMLYLRKAKYIVFGPEPIFAYAFGKKRELQLVRLLGVGKINQIPPETLKERISETYA